MNPFQLKKIKFKKQKELEKTQKINAEKISRSLNNNNQIRHNT